MGFSPSPYLVTMDLMVVEQMIRDNRRAQVNIFDGKRLFSIFRVRSPMIRLCLGCIRRDVIIR